MEEELQDISAELAQKIDAFAQSLSPEEAEVIGSVFAAAARVPEAEDDEVGGYILVDPGFNPHCWQFTSCLYTCARVGLRTGSAACRDYCRRRYPGCH